MLAGALAREDGRVVTAVCDIDTGMIRRLPASSADPVWLPGGSRLIGDGRGRLVLIDVRTGRVQEVVSTAPNIVNFRPAVAPDGRSVYVSLLAAEADIWMMQLEE